MIVAIPALAQEMITVFNVQVDLNLFKEYAYKNVLLISIEMEINVHYVIKLVMDAREDLILYATIVLQDMN